MSDIQKSNANNFMFAKRFYKKRWKFASAVHMTIFGFINYIFARVLNKTKVYNVDTLLDLVYNRQKKSLITVCNHDSCCDDPVVFGSFLPLSLLANFRKMKWSLAAKEICFGNPFTSTFFGMAKGLPVVRGEGIYQPIMNEVLQYINNGDWLHIFPEGKVNENKEIMRLKWGVGRLVSEAKAAPIVLPFYHCGLDDIMPNEKPYYRIKLFKKTTVLFGDPIYFDKIVKDMKMKNMEEVEMRKRITDIIQDEFYKLKDQARTLHAENYKKK